MTDTDTEHQTPPAIAALAEQLHQRRMNSTSPLAVARRSVSNALSLIEELKAEVAKPVKQRGPAVFRERDITRAIAGHLKAGLSVDRTMIDKAGNIIIITGKPEPVELAPDQQSAEAVNEWDTPL